MTSYGVSAIFNIRTNASDLYPVDPELCDPQTWTGVQNRTQFDTSK